jgi:hypothetical protein
VFYSTYFNVKVLIRITFALPAWAILTVMAQVPERLDFLARHDKFKFVSETQRKAAEFVLRNALVLGSGGMLCMGVGAGKTFVLIGLYLATAKTTLMVTELSAVKQALREIRRLVPDDQVIDVADQGSLKNMAAGKIAVVSYTQIHKAMPPADSSWSWEVVWAGKSSMQLLILPVSQAIAAAAAAAAATAAC